MKYFRDVDNSNPTKVYLKFLYCAKLKKLATARTLLMSKFSTAVEFIPPGEFGHSIEGTIY